MLYEVAAKYWKLIINYKLQIMIPKDLIKEAMDYLKHDCSYAAIVGTIEYGDIDPNVYKKEPVEEQTFNHVYLQSYGTAMEDSYTGTCLIPFSEYSYLVCEWST